MLSLQYLSFLEHADRDTQSTVFPIFSSLRLEGKKSQKNQWEPTTYVLEHSVICLTTHINILETICIKLDFVLI